MSYSLFDFCFIFSDPVKIHQFVLISHLLFCVFCVLLLFIFIPLTWNEDDNYWHFLSSLNEFFQYSFPQSSSSRCNLTMISFTSILYDFLGLPVLLLPMGLQLVTFSSHMSGLVFRMCRTLSVVLVQYILLCLFLLPFFFWFLHCLIHVQFWWNFSGTCSLAIFLKDLVAF